MTSAMELDGKGLARLRLDYDLPLETWRTVEGLLKDYLTASGLTDRLKELEDERDALAADNAVKDVALAGIEKAVLRGLTETEGKRHRIKLHPDWTVDGQYLLGTTADNIRDSLRGIANIARAALANQPPASLPAEGQGESKGKDC